MPGIEDLIRIQNPWWRDDVAIEADHHLRECRESGLQWNPPALDAIRLEPGRTDTLRGPRQAGKTTTAKRLMARLFERGERRLLYFGFDLVRDYRELPDVLLAAKRAHPDPDGPWYIFLDEITSVPDWQLGIKFAWDAGITRRDYLLLTGSSAHDLRRGAEQLPGRRGGGGDHLQLPMSFRDFLETVRALSLPGDTLAVEQCFSKAGRSTLAALNLRAPELESAWRVYRTLGGYPAAVRDHLATGEGTASDATARILWDTISGDMSRSNRDPVAALKLLEHVAVSLGNPLKWTAAARAMGVADVTARQYVEFLAESFALLAVYFWDLSGGTLSPSKQRKVYVMDPLHATLPGRIVPGARTPTEAGLTENLVAIALFRSAAHTLVQAAAVPGAVAYWRSSNQREIDFVVPESEGPGRIPIEVKGDADSGIAHARNAIRRTFGRGIVVSRSVFDWTEDVPVIPAPVFLAALRERPRRELFVV